MHSRVRLEGFEVLRESVNGGCLPASGPAGAGRVRRLVPLIRIRRQAQPIGRRHRTDITGAANDDIETSGAKFAARDYRQPW
jgi:hypothetical protein